MAYNLILGKGEIGRSLGNILEEWHERVEYHDPPQGIICPPNQDVLALHICISYSNMFREIVIEEITKWNPIVTIIHSTVPVGTTNSIITMMRKDKLIVYSPIRGRHPNLEKDIKKFVKYYASTSYEADSTFFSIFHRLSIEKFPDFNSLEFAKVADTTYFGVCLAYMRFVRETCNQLGLDFDSVYQRYNQTYNQGMQENFRRPIYEFMPGPIGGHCVIPNLNLLPDTFKDVKTFVEAANQENIGRKTL